MGKGHREGCIVKSYRCGRLDFYPSRELWTEFLIPTLNLSYHKGKRTGVFIPQTSIYHRLQAAPKGSLSLSTSSHMYGQSRLR